MRQHAMAENDEPSSGLIIRIQKGDILYNCISGLRSHSLQVKIYIQWERYKVSEMYNLKFIKC